METMGDWFKSYRRLSFINTGVGDPGRYRRTCRAQAREHGWEYEELPGDTGLIDRLLGGDWDERDFLVVEPGRTIAASQDASIICSTD